MTTYFKILAQIQTRADYDKILRTALSKPGPEAFHYFDTYPFDKKEAPLLLVGDIGKPLLADLKKAAPKAAYATGTCTVNTKDEIVLDRTAGKLQIKELTAGLRLSGIKNVVKLAGEDKDEDEGGEGEMQEPPPSGTTTAPKPAAKSALPPLSEAAKVQLKPVPQQGKKPIPPQDPAVTKQWQDKVKVLKPLYEQALLKAKTQKGGTWAEDLEGAYDQMVHEAKSGDFVAAMASLGRLARSIKSEEAARAEAKHQTNREDPNYREATEQTARERFGKEFDKQQRSESKKGGFGVSDDGNVTYAKAYTAAEWKAGVIDPLSALNILLSADEPDLARFEKALERASQMVGRAVMHQHESDGRHPERREAVYEVEEAMRHLQSESARLLMKNMSVKTARQITEDCSKLKEDIRKYVYEQAPRGRRSEQELLAFAREAGERKRRRHERLGRIEQEVQDKQQEFDMLEKQVLSQKLPEHHPRRREMEALGQELAGLRKILFGTTMDKFDPDVGEREMQRLYAANVADPDKVLAVLDELEQVKDMLGNGAYDQAMQRAYRLPEALGLDGAQEGAAQELHYELNALPSHIQMLRDASSASVRAILGLAEDAKEQATKLQKLLG